VGHRGHDRPVPHHPLRHLEVAMCLIQRAAEAEILPRAVDIALDTAKRTTQQMRSVQGRLKADIKSRR